jgi:hypothetical protein
MHYPRIKPLLTLAVASLLAQGAGAAPIVTSVVETGGDNEATDTIVAKWTGVTFPVSIVNEPFPGAAVGGSYVVGTFGNHAPAFVDRNHRYTNASDTVVIPNYLVGHEYIMSGNDNRDNAAYTLDVTVAASVDAYMLIDNRLSDTVNSNPPTFDATHMQWITDDGWLPSRTGANRTRDISLPDEIAFDEGADGTLNQWYSIYTKSFPAGTFRVKQADNTGQNMYGLVVTPAKAGRVVTVNTIDNDTFEVGAVSLQMALTDLQDGDRIQFSIPGDGPHVITTPLGGYPLISAHNVTIDGYSQPGSAANVNPILGGNNAKIKVVLDSTGADSGASDPQDASLNSRRSTRILHSGYGDSENGILAVLGGDNFDVSGLSFIGRYNAGSTDDPAIYAVALVNQATNAHIHGCLFGMAPGGSAQEDVKPVAAAVAAFRYRTGGDVYSFGVKIGTDGNGVTDRKEFNVVLGARDAFPLELPGARISGNYVNVFPNGLTFVDLDATYQSWRDAFEAGGSDPEDAHIENYENGRVTAGTVIGTNGDGVSDSDERNIFGHVVYDHHGEFYSSSVNAVLAGNYFGVGIDGVTPSPVSTNGAPDFVEFGGGQGQVRIGSNGDGVSDDLEGNLIVNVPGGLFIKANSATPVVSRRNKMVNCGVAAVPFAEGNNGAQYATYYAPYLADASQGVAPVLQSITGGILKGTMQAPSAAYPNAALDLYLADPAALAKANFWPAAMTHPGRFLGSYTDNGPADLNPNANEISIDVSGLGLTDTTYLAAAASYSSIAGSFNAPNAVTSPMSNPVSAKPTLAIKVNTTLNTTELSWLGVPDAFDLQINNEVGAAGNWVTLPAGGVNHVGGRNVLTTTAETFEPAYFYRLISK